MHKLLTTVVMAVQPLPRLEVLDLLTVIWGKITHVSAMMYCYRRHPYEG